MDAGYRYDANMSRTVILIIAFLSVLPALAHGFDGPDRSSAMRSADYGVSAVQCADVIDDNQDHKDNSSEAPQHCVLHSAALASVFEFGCWFGSSMPPVESWDTLPFQHTGRIMRPPDVV